MCDFFQFVAAQTGRKGASIDKLEYHVVELLNFLFFEVPHNL